MAEHEHRDVDLAGPDRIQIKALVKYGRTAASTRQRVLQFIPHLEAVGIQVRTHALLHDDYVRKLVTGEKQSRLRVGWDYLKRVWLLLFSPRVDILWIYAESFPYLPRAFEWLATRRKEKIIYDMDDAFFHQYDDNRRPLIRRVLGGKLELLMQQAYACTCGNRYLQNHASRFCYRPLFLPTVVDTEVYRPRESAKTQATPLTIGWIGSPSTWPYVRPLLDLLTELSCEYNVKVRVIGAGIQAEKDAFFGLELVEWREDREIQEVQAMDIGIMPLPNDSWARGKSGYKLIQYMACGLPVIASPVGANVDIVQDELTGLLADNTDEWRQALIRLITDGALRTRLGQSARKRIEEHYSLARNSATLIELFHEAAQSAESCR